MQEKVYKYMGYVMSSEPYLGERLVIIEEEGCYNPRVESLDRPGYRWYICRHFLVDEDTDIVPRGYCKFKYKGQERYGFLTGYTTMDNEVHAEIRSCADDFYVEPEGVERVPLDMVFWNASNKYPATGETHNKYIFDGIEELKTQSTLAFPLDGELYYYTVGDPYIRKVKDPTAKFIYCQKCGELHSINKFNFRAHGIFSSTPKVCFDCITKHKLELCNNCNKYHPAADIVTHAGHKLCNSCCDHLYPKCRKCGERHYYLDYIYVKNNRYCPVCLKTLPNLRQCAHCNSYFLCKEDSSSTEQMYCEDCLDSAREYDGEILDYHEPYILPFLGNKDELYMGVELEIDDGGECNSNSKKIHDAIGKLHAVMMHDGSLDEGFEIVSAPATLKAHTEIINWKAAMKKAVSLGYCSHKTNTCGMHVHVDRAYFKDKNGSMIYEDKFAMLFANNVEWIKKLSRREHWDYCGIEDAAAVKTTRADAEKGICKAKPYKGGSHHVAVNYGTNKPTIEIRIFRGTLSYNTFIARLQFVQLFCDFVKHTPFADLADIQMENFINEAKTRGYSELIANMKSLNIYKEE